jgi:hypothetical protein
MQALSVTPARDLVGRRGSDALVITAVVLVSVLGGLAVASGRGTVAVAAAAAPLVLFVVPRLSRAAGLPAGYFSIELPLALMLISTLVFRSRDATALANNPLDSAAIIRLVSVGAAAVVAWIGFLRPPLDTVRVPMPPAIIPYALYIAVVFMGAPLSQDLTLTTYRGIELSVALFVVVSAVRFGGRDAVRRLERVMFVFVVALLCSVYAGLVLAPHEALICESGNGPVSCILGGIFPALSPNTVGELGVVLLLWSLGLRLSGRMSTRWAAAFIVLGGVSCIASQYRTGYFGAAAVLALLLIVRGRKAFALIAVTVALLAALVNSSAIVNAAEPYALRGQNTRTVGELSGRISFWKAAIPVWEESPIIGKGLLTATRFEVLAPLGFTSTSTIHGTWIEALVGTGVVGVTLLALYLVLLWRAALPDLFSRSGLVYPGLLVAFFTLRSITGTTFEAFTSEVPLLLLILAFALSAHRMGDYRAPSVR